MSEAAPITTQPVKLDRRHQDEESETEHQEKRKQTCWQRCKVAFKQCYGDMIDCLDFWCCRNECCNFCCNYNDVDEDEDEREVAYMRDVEVVDDQAALTDMTSHNSQANNGDVGISETKLHGDQTSGHYNTGNDNKLIHDVNQGNAREGAYIRDVEVVYGQAALTDMINHNTQAHRGDVGISETKLHGDHHLGNQTSGYSHTGNVNHGGYHSGDNHGWDNSGGHHHVGDHSGSNHHVGDQLGSQHHAGVHSGSHQNAGDHSGSHHHVGDHSGSHQNAGDHSGGNNHCVVGDSGGGGDCGWGDSGGGDYGGGDCGGGGGND